MGMPTLCPAVPNQRQHGSRHQLGFLVSHRSALAAKTALFSFVAGATRQTQAQGKGCSSLDGGLAVHLDPILLNPKWNMPVSAAKRPARTT